MNQCQKHSKVFYNFADNVMPEKVPLEWGQKNLRHSNISNEKIALIIDELYKFSIITFKMFNENEG